MKKLLVLVLLAVLAGGFLLERRSTAMLRAENEARRAQVDEMQRLTEEARDVELLRTTGGPAAERGGSSELLRLRNEVRQLRAQQQEVEKLRAANQRLAGEMKNGQFAPRRLADLEGAVPREKWAFSGFATPEAAVQSFFAAVVSGDPEQFLRCAGPKAGEAMRRQMAADPEKMRREFSQEMGKLGKVSAFRIQGTRPRGEDPDRLEILVQVVADGEAMPLPLRRIGSEWKVDD